MTLGDCVAYAAEQFDGAGLFYGHGTDNAWDEAVYLIFSVLGLPFDREDIDPEQELSAAQQQQIELLVARRIEQRIPVAYLVGEAWFAGLPFNVDERVLVPRSPIAELIHNGFQPMLDASPRRALDLCTGSGCIGIATALTFPDCQVDLADISQDALAVADSNIRRHGVEDRVRVIQSDLFQGLTGKGVRYDLIVSNPPYVSAEEVAELPAEYHQEPALGLLSDDDGLAIPLQILRQAPDFLSEQGVLILELGYSWSVLAERYPQLPVTWLEFDNGGEGVLAIDRASLIRAMDVIRV
ncbi:50S ribosomal protein L3 N(5)-glutamine methyltransferase [Pseudohongiella sp. SYSU M77423]|uniref:50S ribosomal protein L3 N(5)-glutamine methyltransferase n=1 Tax=Pseudohongiella sp. SYSU M77423 TaxID=3042312 RepID=UPI0024812A9E|nr:50S ribosomal protein L3 N(5)-glutamine methyltransferase [Pseudohongiella sp. SYSU M77423]MDH7945095.1 50S ribosomal protein L3 N(5)-glutamine methyltransferase [Pseudohongiella sp. SYSU M77423]